MAPMSNSADTPILTPGDRRLLVASRTATLATLDPNGSAAARALLFRAGSGP